MLLFKPISIEDRPIMKPFFDEWRFEGSELTFTNLLIWQKGADIQYAILDDVLYIMMLTESDKRFFLPPIPRHADMDYSKAVRVAQEHIGHLHLRFVLRSANTKLKSKMEHCCTDQLEFVEDRSNYDYVYNARDLIELRGKKYHSKRNHINKLLQDHRCEYMPYTPEYMRPCLELYGQWTRGKDINPGEPPAVEAALRYFAELELKGGVLLIDGRVEAFSIGERLSDNMAVIHIEKAGDIPGAFPHINQQFAEHAWSDVKYINREEDMGIEGMRKAKLSYHPAFLIKKYNVYERESG